MDLPGRGHRIRGEIYAVDRAKLAWLDEFEGVPDHYERRQETVELLDGDGARENGCERDVSAFMYLLKRHKPFMLQLPMLEEYSSDGPHGLRFNEEGADLDIEAVGADLGIF